jgi:uncharacterized protein YjbI with pentapeptide repeats
MWYILQAQESSGFLKGIDLIWIIGIISGLVTGIWAFYRFVYEKKLERFKEAATNIFSDNEDLVLAAVANLGVFKKDFLFEKNTIDVLLTRLYKELNYNITNAIANALIQFSNRRELLYIGNEVLGINRNFFFQNKPVKYMLGDINMQFTRISKIRSGNIEGIIDIKDIEKEKEILEKRQARYVEAFMKLNENIGYELLWHQQVTGDTYARIIRRAGALKRQNSETFFGYLKQVFLSWDFRFYGAKIPFNLYQNPFAYVHLVQFKTSSCSIRRSGFEKAIIADVEFNNIDEIYDCSFNGTYLNDCIFNKGIIRASLLTGASFFSIKFRKIEFRDIFFAGATFGKCEFTNCTGLTASSFYGASLDDKTILPASITRDSITNLNALQAMKEVRDSGLGINDKESVIKKQASNVKSLNEILDIFNSDLENVMKEEIIMEAGRNFKFDQTLVPVQSLKIDNLHKLQILQLLFEYKPLEKFVVEMYDAKLTNDLYALLPLIKRGVSIADYEKAINQSELLDAERKTLINEMKGLPTAPDNKNEAKEK